MNTLNYTKVIIQKPDLDTCLTGLILGVSSRDEILVTQAEPPKEHLSDPCFLCIESGGSGQVYLNNFDHHNCDTYFPPACKQAFDLYGQNNKKLERLVEYVCNVDERKQNPVPIEFPSLSNIFSGMLLNEKNLKQQFLKGLHILNVVMEKGIDPFKTMPALTQWGKYIKLKQINKLQVEKSLKNITVYKLKNGKKMACLESVSIGGIGSLYAQGFDYVLMYNRAFGNPPVPKMTLAGNNLPVNHLLHRLNDMDEGWGGHATIIGSPRAGMKVKKEDVLNVVLNYL